MHAWYLIVQKTIYFYEIIPTGITKWEKVGKIGGISENFEKKVNFIFGPI